MLAHTSDDKRDQVVSYDYDANGALLTATTHYGADGVLNFNDGRYTYAYDTNGRSVFDTHVTADADGLFGTADDQFGYHATNFDAQGNETTELSSTKVDSDGKTFPIAAVFSFSTHTLGTASTLERYSSYTGAGVDAQIFTSDDVLNSYAELTRDSRGNLVRIAHYAIPFGSPAGSALTVSDYFVSTYDAHDNLVQRIAYTDAGADGVWFTGDDTVFGITDFDTTH